MRAICRLISLEGSLMLMDLGSLLINDYRDGCSSLYFSLRFYKGYVSGYA